jgi:hypothetical protein
MVTTDELILKEFDALFDQYHKLYVKEFAFGGINQDEFMELKRLFIESCHMAKSLLAEFVRRYDGIDTDDFDIVLERAEHWHILHYAYCWKRMYHVLLPHAETNSMTPKEESLLFSSHDLLKIPNYALAAWLILEKEKGITGKDDPELLRKLIDYLSWHVEEPFWYDYPEIPFTTRAEIWETALKHDYGDIHPDVWDCHVMEFFKEEVQRLWPKASRVYKRPGIDVNK